MNYDKIPVPYMTQSIRNWVEHGIEPGSFLFAVLANDFTQAALKADVSNSLLLREWALFMVNEMPANSWGSYDKLKEWSDFKRSR